MSSRRSCALCAVRQDALCGALAKEQLPGVNRIAYRRRYDAGQFILGAGQRQDWCATVLSGVVKLTKTLPDGRQQIVGLLFPSDLLGRPFAPSSSYCAEAATAVELCCLERQYFEDLMAGSPAMKQLFLERTLDEVDATREWMLLLGRKTAEERVASLLLLMAQRVPLEAAGEGKPPHCDVPLSRMEMAEYLGLRFETISRQLMRLKQAGVIDIQNGRSITIHDLGKLAQICGKSPLLEQDRP